MPSPFDDELISVLALKALRVAMIVGDLRLHNLSRERDVVGGKRARDGLSPDKESWA